MVAHFIKNPSIKDIKCTQLKDFLSIWKRVQQQMGAPARCHFTFRLLKDHLPNIAIMDYEAETERFRVSLIGTEYTAMIGQEMTGRFIDDIDHTAGMVERCDWVIQHRKPYLVEMEPFAWAGRDYKSYSTLGCPLFGDDGNVNKILFLVSFNK